jgi:arylsulfatase A-like enzyme
MQFDFCQTVDEIGQRLAAVEAGRPVFAHTRSLNLHVAAVRSGPVPAGESYPGFHPPYASRVRRIDRCLGDFVDRLKRRGLYERSLMIVTSDHGELLGEDGQWGHSYHMIPEVIRIPLFVHLPTSGRAFDPDLEAVAFSTDITPTVYDVLGYPLQPGDGLVGRTLLGEAEAAAARRADHVLAASYGAVFAALRRNGRALYIANAIRGEDAAMARTPDGFWRRTEVTKDLRSANQFVIRQYVDAVRRRYGLMAAR